MKFQIKNPQISKMLRFGLFSLSLSCSPLSTSQHPSQLAQLQNEINPGSKGSKPTELTGSIITSFDLGQTLTPADFQVIDSADFKTAQQRSGFRLEDIYKAVVSITPQGTDKPVQAELKREEIAKGWVFVFRNLQVGQAKVQLKILGAQDQVLFEQSQSVQVEANLVTPVSFLLDLDSPQGGCSGPTCTGSIQVRVQARTHCLGIPRFPGTGKVQESLLFGLDSIQGSVQRFLVNFGDGSPIQTVSSLPVRHAYASPGRYKVSVTLEGEACKSPFEIGASLSIQK